MNKVIQLFLVSTFFVFSSMQCHDETILKLTHELELSITPDPIPVTNGKAKFTCDMLFPTSKRFNKIDSLVLEFLTRVNDEDIILGTSVLDPAQRKISKSFEVNDLRITNDVALYIQMKLYHKGRFKTSPRLAISMFTSEQ